MDDITTRLTELVISAFMALIAFGLLSLVLSILAYLVFTIFKHRKREPRSLDSILLQIAVPRDSEVKIDAAEQMFAALYSIKKGGWKQRFDTQETISFELVAKSEDIRFYVWCPRRLHDLVEKQIYGAYTDAEIIEVGEYNLFTENGKVAYSTVQLRNPSFNPIKIYKDLATDPLSSLTSALAKMEEGEAVGVQVLL